MPRAWGGWLCSGNRAYQACHHTCTMVPAVPPGPAAVPASSKTRSNVRRPHGVRKCASACPRPRELSGSHQPRRGLLVADKGATPRSSARKVARRPHAAMTGALTSLLQAARPRFDGRSMTDPAAMEPALPERRCRDANQGRAAPLLPLPHAGRARSAERRALPERREHSP